MWYIERMTGTVFYKHEVVGQFGSSEVSLLSGMLEEPSRIFTKDELLDLGWPGKIVAPNSLTVAIKNIRKVFGYRPSKCSIETKHGQGYILHLPLENEITIVDHNPVSAQTQSNNENNSVVDELEPAVKTTAENIDYKIKKRGLIFTLLKLMAMVGLFFLLLFVSVAIIIYDKKTHCENINGIKFCGSRPLTFGERTRLQNSQVNIDKNVDRYIYGYNYTTQNMVFYPLH
ncbi:helix-turn-helix domain-containing protein [Aeromonas veronii]|uniref:winged helix-turn-helix domain-containing protein n=1 Tax=Aeromonas veronii TaxID=654 RepID=UPI0013022BA2|nr:helix-turn-helix domain-containing protein [Aeromonas veronii]KAE9625322.1 hypothetical protein GO627_07975 [Aeromonas veronii]MBW3778027.1 helix-turn-helix domain-containing protein [Aeromonas veronii]